MVVSHRYMGVGVDRTAFVGALIGNAYSTQLGMWVYLGYGLECLRDCYVALRNATSFPACVSSQDLELAQIHWL